MALKGEIIMVIFIFVIIVVGFMLAVICARYVHKWIVVRRLTRLFGYPINDDSFHYLNKEYYHQLSQKEITSTIVDDFELDRVFNLMNRTYSDVGREYMYAQLFSSQHQHVLLESIISNLQDPKKFKKTLYELYRLSQTYSESLELFEHLQFLSRFDFFIVIVSSLCPLLFLGAGLIYGVQVFQYVILWISLQGMLYAHYTKKTNHALTQASSYCYLASTLNKLNRLSIYPQAETEKIKRMTHTALRYTWINKIDDFVSDIDVFYIMELIKGIFSLPIYQCYFLKKHSDELIDDFLKMYEYVGIVDMAIAIMSIRQSYATCIPEIRVEEGICFQECYHPLLEEPVKNSFSTHCSCLITGSNASGKSTFLKTIGVNIMMAKAYHTCFADEFSYYPYYLCSSIHMKDDIESGDSYYVKEIKTLKTILDHVKQQKCIVFIDEILRGTNEKERVMIAKAILQFLFSSDSLIFVTTHDLSIVQLFDDIDKYCFNDYIHHNELCSDYKIKHGVCTVGNAIALLEVYGFDQDVISELKKPI